MTNTLKFQPVPNDGYPAGSNGGNMTTTERIEYNVHNDVSAIYGIELHTATDANGHYLHGRLDNGTWIVATDAEGYDMQLAGRIEHETATVCECCGDAREPRAIGWSVGIYRNCTVCGDDHPATHDSDGCLADIVVYDATADQLPVVIGSLLASI